MTNLQTRLTIKADVKGKEEVDNLNKSIDNLGNQSDSTSHQQHRLAQSTKSANTALIAQKNASDNAASSLDNLNKLMGAFGITLGATAFASGAKSLIEMADSFGQIEARVKLATEGGADFITAMEGIKRIAGSTGSDLDATATLFNKLSTATKQLGLSQQETLGITETITQAFKISGASSEEAKNAITQLSQALSSGVLRGDEFNSVMEQGGRLTTALADGLGVSIGQLRKMAGEGKLTSDVITQALQSQSQRINEEYATLPKTVGSAMTTLKNTVLTTIGELNSELGATAGLAEFIQGIADNINNIDPRTIDAVKTAFSNLGDVIGTIWQTASDLVDSVNALSSSDTSFITNQLQKLALATSALADGFKALQIVVQGVFGVIEKGASKVAYVFETLSGKTHEYSQNLEAHSTAMFDKMHQNVMSFESQTQKAWHNLGQTTAERLNEQARHAKAAYEQMATDGTTSAQELESAFVNYATKAIEANNGVINSTLQKELAEKNLQATISQTGQISITSLSAQKQAMDDTAVNMQALEDSAKALGVNLEEALGKTFTDQLQNLSNLSVGFEALEATGTRASNSLMTAFDKILKTAQTQNELEQLKAAITDFGNKGQLSAQQVSQAMEGISQALNKINPALSATEQAFERLGIKTREQLALAAQTAINDFNTIAKSGQATAEGLEMAYKKMMAAVNASGNASLQSTAKAQARLVGLADTADKTGTTIASSMAKSTQAVDTLSTATNQAAQGFDKMGQAAAKAGERVKNSSASSAKGRVINEGQALKLSDIIAMMKQAGYNDSEALQKARGIFDVGAKKQIGEARGLYGHIITQMRRDFVAKNGVLEKNIKVQIEQAKIAAATAKAQEQQKQAQEQAQKAQEQAQKAAEQKEQAQKQQLQKAQAQLKHAQEQLKATPPPSVANEFGELMSNLSELLQSVKTQALQEAKKALIDQLTTEVKRLPR